MTHQVETAIVRIRDKHNKVVGVGFLVTNQYFLTCTHVILDALGISRRTDKKPTDSILFDFPLIASNKTLTGKIRLWQTDIDFAGVEIIDSIPPNATPLHLVYSENLWGHDFQAFGFPAGYDDGVWASGLLRGRQAKGWVQIEDVKETGYFVAPGFSGTPVWDEQLKGVVGMVIAADVQAKTKAAFMLPTKILINVWPELEERSLDADDLAYLQVQLNAIKEAQKNSPAPQRFQPKIEELEAAIANWNNRIESQRQRIDEGLTDQRQQIIENSKRLQDREKTPAIGQRPLGSLIEHFKNRIKERTMVGQLLAKSSTRLVSVIGHGGMGKTALAAKILRDLEYGRWPHTDENIPLDGIVYLSTRTAGISLEKLFLDCAKLLGGEKKKTLEALWVNPKITITDKVIHLLNSLKDGQYVILLDNIEDLLDEKGQFIDEELQLFFENSLAYSSNVRLLVTSRQALSLKREVLRFNCSGQIHVEMIMTIT